MAQTKQRNKRKSKTSRTHKARSAFLGQHKLAAFIKRGITKTKKNPYFNYSKLTIAVRNAIPVMCAEQSKSQPRKLNIKLAK